MKKKKINNISIGLRLTAVFISVVLLSVSAPFLFMGMNMYKVPVSASTVPSYTIAVGSTERHGKILEYKDILKIEKITDNIELTFKNGQKIKIPVGKSVTE